MGTVRFLAHGATWEVVATVGETLRELSKRANAPEGDACGGVCACSTCHVYVVSGGESLGEREEDEEDILDKAFDVRAGSRLGCQAKLVRDGDLTVEIARESLDAYYNEHPKVLDPRKKR